MEMSAPLSAKAEHTHNILTNRYFLILTLSDWDSQKLNTLFLQDKEEEAMNRICACAGVGLHTDGMYQRHGQRS